MEATDALRAKAFTMRWEKKMTYQAIAQALGVSRVHAFRLANDGWAALIEDTNEERLSKRAVEVERLEELIDSLWELAIGDVATISLLDPEVQIEVIKNKPKIHGAISKHLQMICRLEGLNVPAKFEPITKKTESLENFLTKFNASKARRAGMVPPSVASRS